MVVAAMSAATWVLTAVFTALLRRRARPGHIQANVGHGMVDPGRLAGAHGHCGASCAFPVASGTAGTNENRDMGVTAHVPLV